MKPTLVLVIINALFLLTLPAHAEQGSLAKKVKKEKKGLSVSTGLVYSDTDRDNDYAATITSIPLSLKYKYNRWLFSFSVAHIKVNTHDWVVTEVYEDPLDPDFIEIWEELLPFEQDGFGDSVVGIQYTPQLKSLSNHRFVIGGKVKLPTGDEDQGLSSGETDFTFFLGDMYRIKRFVLDARIGYQKIGLKDDPFRYDIVDDLEARRYESLELDDWSDDSLASSDWDFGDWYLDEPENRQEKNSQRTYLSLGGLYLIDRNRSIGASLYQKSASHKGRDDIQKLNIFYSQKINREWSYSIFAAKGLNNSSVDLSVGFQITKKM